MNKYMTRLALAAKWAARGARGVLAVAAADSPDSSDASAIPPNPTPQSRRNQRRATSFFRSVACDSFIAVHHRSSCRELNLFLRSQFQLFVGHFHRSAILRDFNVGRPENTVYNCSAKNWKAKVLMKVSECCAKATSFVAIRPFQHPGNYLIFAVYLYLQYWNRAVVKFHIQVELVMQLVGLPTAANGMFGILLFEN